MGRSKVIVVFVCVCASAVISCCPATVLSLDAWRHSDVSCCPGTPAERRPAPRPGSHRPPSPSGLKPQDHKQCQTTDFIKHKTALGAGG